MGNRSVKHEKRIIKEICIVITFCCPGINSIYFISFKQRAMY